jgi:Periplasmic copper-binding protein (NosD)
MRSRRIRRIAGCMLAPLLVAGAVAAQAGAASAATTANGSHTTLYVSPGASSRASGLSCRSARFRSIQSAVNAAGPGSAVVVCQGTYHEQVVVNKPVSLQGQGATIDEAGVKPAFQVHLPPPFGTQTIFAAVVMISSGIRFGGFTVTHAQGEGILAAGLGRVLSGISISDSTVVHNDLGFGVKNSPYFECAVQGTEPGDCGEGVHFTAVAYSAITGSFIGFNAGGVLLSDDTGPTHGNLVSGNVVTGNATDCGITVPGHNPAALNAKGQPQPSVAGVYDNVIRGNTVTNNGVKGEGAGVLFANAMAGTASYGNLVENNYIAGNGLSGVTMHAHTIKPGQFEDLSGNNVISNFIGKNNLDGDTLDCPPHSTCKPQDLVTTGVLVFSGGTRVTTTITLNKIADNAIGIWLSKAVTAAGLRNNGFANVTTPISAGH